MPRRRCLLLLAASATLSCKPATPEEQFRRALGWHDVDRVREFLDQGRAANAPFDDGDTPLHVVAGAINGSAEVARLLLERGADVAALDRKGRTPWDVIWGDRRSIGADHAAILVALLEAGHQPSTAAGPDGRTLLHEVAERCPSSRIVALLVRDRGMAVDARDELGWTPLHHAAYHDNPEAAVGLLAHGADVDAETTKVFGRSQQRGTTEVWTYKYEAGSRPLDVASNDVRRNAKSVRAVLAEYGGTSNPAVDNRR